MKATKISIITVSYNSAATIEKTILSVLEQSYPHIEYIVIDGGSRDGTVDIIRKYADKIAYWVSEADDGIYFAMNKGIAAATGEFIQFLNTGDCLAGKDAVAEFVPRIHEDTVVAYGDMLCTLLAGQYISHPKPLENLRGGSCIPHPSTMTSSSYHKAHPFDSSFRLAADYDFFYKAYLTDKVKFQYIPLTLSVYDAETGASKDNFLDNWKESKRIWSRNPSMKIRLARCKELLVWRYRKLLSRFVPQSRISEHVLRIRTKANRRP